MNDSDTSRKEKELRERGLAFFGAITASVSHELNNVISIIDQSAGLLDDLLAGAGAGQPLDNEKLERISGSILKQTGRGLTILRQLNRFAHTVDDARCQFEMTAVVDILVRLCQRLAGLKRMELGFDSAGTDVLVLGSPFLLEQAVFAVLRQTLDEGNRDDRITVSVLQDQSFGMVTVGAVPSGVDLVWVNHILSLDSGGAELTADGAVNSVCIKLPLATSRAE